MPSYSGPSQLSTISVVEVDSKPSNPCQIFMIHCCLDSMLNCCLDYACFAHSFLIMPSCPTPLLGQDILTKLSIETRQSWVTLLSLALTRLRATPRSPTGLSPFELVYGRPLALRELPILPTPLAPYLSYLSLLRQLLREHAERSLPPPT